MAGLEQEYHHHCSERLAKLVPHYALKNQLTNINLYARVEREEGEEGGRGREGWGGREREEGREG